MAGHFITFEGGEGAGKSTHVRLLADALRGAGVGVVETREPGGSPGAEQIRELLIHGEVARWDAMTEALLHFAARRDHVARVIRPALASGDWVLCDRFADSTMAYQGYGHGLALEAIEQLYALTVGALAPDLTVILDLPVGEGLRRAETRRKRRHPLRTHGPGLPRTPAQQAFSRSPNGIPNAAWSSMRACRSRPCIKRPRRRLAPA